MLIFETLSILFHFKQQINTADSASVSIMNNQRIVQ